MFEATNAISEHERKRLPNFSVFTRQIPNQYTYGFIQIRLVVYVHVMIGTRHASLTKKWSEIDLWPLAQTADVIRVHTLDLSKALKNQGTETTSIWILKKRNGSRLTRTCRCRLLNRDNTSSIFSTDVQMDGWLWKSMHISTESKGFKDGRLQQRLMLEATWVTEAHE